MKKVIRLKKGTDFETFDIASKDAFRKLIDKIDSGWKIAETCEVSPREFDVFGEIGFFLIWLNALNDDQRAKFNNACEHFFLATVYTEFVNIRFMEGVFDDLTLGEKIFDSALNYVFNSPQLAYCGDLFDIRDYIDYDKLGEDFRNGHKGGYTSGGYVFIEDRG